MILSSGTSILAAGVISSLCFFLINGLWKGKAEGSKQRRKRSVLDDSRCACCLKPFVIDRGVICDNCGARSCRKSCSRWDTPENSWLCLFCYQRRLLQSWLRRNDKWFENFGGVPVDESNNKFSTAKSQVYIAGTEHARISPELGMAAGGEEEGNSMETIRDFVEKIVEDLVGNVDETPIDRLYDHPAYKPNTDTPIMAHTALRELVERAVEEAKKLPRLGGSDSDRTEEGHDMSEQSYEDLLATAILNKVIKKYQAERVDDNSNVLHKKTSPRSKYITSEIEVGLDEGVEEGSSSLEPLSQDECSSECSVPPRSNVRDHHEPLSLMIEEHIEEVTTTYTSDEERETGEDDELDFQNAHRVPFPEFGMDIIDPSQDSSEEDTNDESSSTTYVDHVTPIESWEENWLFQKKKIKTQPESVAMLVPNPSADFRALIGDKDAEDTSDLSECSAHSDEEIDEELMEAINNVVPKTSGSLDLPDAGYLERNDGSVKIQGQKVKSVTEETRVKTEKCDEVIEEAVGTSTKQEVITKTMSRKEDEKTSEKPDEVQRVSGKLQVTAEVHTVDGLSLKEDEERCEKKTSEITVKEKDLEIKEEETNNIRTFAKDACATSDSKNLIVKSRKVEKQQEDVDESTEKEKRTTAKHDEAEENFENRIKDEFTCSSNLMKDSRLFQNKEDPSKEHAKLSARILDEKLVSVENEINSKQNTSKTNLKNYARNTEDNDSLETDVDRLLDIDKIVEKKKANGHHTNDLQGEDGAQQESEYTEHYDIAIQRHLNSLKKTKIPQRKVTIDNENEAWMLKSLSPTEMLWQCRAAMALAEAESARQSQPVERKKVQVDIELAAPPRPGTIAEREHRKWENAAPIENNPYSEENIQKRLWERQYARRSSSDVPGDNTELSKSSNSPVPLQVVLGANQVDYKRYGRDYYINYAKVASGEKLRRSAISNTSRPGSSLSQYSSLTGSDLEQQVETESVSISNAKSKVTKWQQNNVETNLQQEAAIGKQRIEGVDSNDTLIPEIENEEENRFKSNVTATQKLWERREVEEMLEHERKNNKNEINAKLNNQENIDGGACILDGKRSYSDESQRKIHRIDLKAYGFENEINEKSSSASKSQQRVVNKLDLKSFGYDVGLRRTRSINQIDSKINNVNVDAGTRFVKAKSNLTQHSDYGRSRSSRNLVECEASGDYCSTKSTEILNDSEEYLEIRNRFNGMTPAKSMPNVAKIGQYSSKIQTCNDEGDIVINAHVEQVNEVVDEEKLEQETKNMTLKSHGAWNSETTTLATERSGDSSEIYSKDHLEKLTEETKPIEELTQQKEEFRGLTEVSLTKCKSEKDPKEATSPPINPNKDEPFLPSVRKLARAFDRTPEVKPTAAPRGLIDDANVSAQVSKSTGNLGKDRSTTPEIQLVETPRQMHSLTARSLSKEFREGLRQMSNKVILSPASHTVVVEQLKVPENQAEALEPEADDNVVEEIDVIAPGKLKNNIKFWEELQRRG